MKQFIFKLCHHYLLTPTLQMLLYLTLFCGIMMSIQAGFTGNYSYLFLGWNLFLAWIPVYFALLWKARANKKPMSWLKQLICFCLWLLFFPNAPYIITDLVHLNRWFKPLLWTDIIIFFSFAATGLIVGLYSLYHVHMLLKNQLNPLKAKVIVCASLILSSYGIYLGRVQRWNSWDIITNPLKLITDSFAQLSNPEAISITVSFSIFLCVLYSLLIKIVSHVKAIH
jgi:uncharacterized membrane protein